MCELAGRKICFGFLDSRSPKWYSQKHMAEEIYGYVNTEDEKHFRWTGFIGIFRTKVTNLF